MSEEKIMNDNFTYEFQPDEEQVTVIGISGAESSGRKDGIKLWSAFHKSALLGLKYIKEKYPNMYTSGLHVYIGEYNDHLWLGFNNPGDFLSDIFIGQLKGNLPREHFIVEESTSSIIPMVYSLYPDKILAFSTDRKIGESYKDEEYGTLLELTPSELFPEEMRNLL